MLDKYIYINVIIAIKICFQLSFVYVWCVCGVYWQFDIEFECGTVSCCQFNYKSDFFLSANNQNE